jgi:hypothetical protein
MAMDLALDWAGLDGALEVPGDVIAVLCNLDVFYLNRTVVHASGVNRPVALHIVWRLLRQSDSAKNQRRENKTSKPHCRAHSLHSISP